MQFAKNVAFGTGRALKATGQATYGALSQIPSRIMAAKKRSGFGIHKTGKGENFGVGTKKYGVRLNSADIWGYKPPQENKPKIQYRTKTKYVTKYVYRKKRR